MTRLTTAPIKNDRFDGIAQPSALLVPAIAAVAIIYTVWVNVYPQQPGAYRVLPWLVLLWCCAPVAATLINPRLVARITSGFLAVDVPTKQRPPAAP